MAIAADDQHVYWSVELAPGATPTTNGSYGALMVASKDCHPKPTVFASKTTPPEIVLDQHNVYWCGPGIMKRPKTGGGATTLVDGGCPLALDKDQLFFAKGKTLRQMDLPSGQVSDFYALPAGQYYGLAVDADSVYFTTGDSVWRVARQTGSATRIAGGQQNATSIAVGAKGVYWIDGSSSAGVDMAAADGSLMAAPLAGGSVRTLASGLTGPSSLVIDAQSAFIVGNPITTQMIPLLRVPLAGGKAVVMVDGIGDDHAQVAVDDKVVYYVKRSSQNDELDWVSKSYSP